MTQLLKYTDQLSNFDKLLYRIIQHIMDAQLQGKQVNKLYEIINKNIEIGTILEMVNSLNNVLIDNGYTIKFVITDNQPAYEITSANNMNILDAALIANVILNDIYDVHHYGAIDFDTTISGFEFNYPKYFFDNYKKCTNNTLPKPYNIAATYVINTLNNQYPFIDIEEFENELVVKFNPLIDNNNLQNNQYLYHVQWLKHFSEIHVREDLPLFDEYVYRIANTILNSNIKQSNYAVLTINENIKDNYDLSFISDIISLFSSQGYDILPSQKKAETTILIGHQENAKLHPYIIAAATLFDMYFQIESDTEVLNLSLIHI